MAKIALSVAIATVIFFVVMLFWNGNGFGTEALLATAINSLMFALFYGAIRVALVIFRGTGK